MGIVLKRRDNANIVKRIVGGMVDILLNQMDVNGAIEFVRNSIEKLLKNKYPLTDFVTSKTLRGTYKDRTKMPHVCLADRMKLRDPGNAPQVNERVPYIAIVTNEEEILKSKNDNFRNTIDKLCDEYVTYKKIFRNSCGLKIIIRKLEELDTTKKYLDGLDELYWDMIKEVDRQLLKNLESQSKNLSRENLKKVKDLISEIEDINTIIINNEKKLDKKNRDNIMNIEDDKLGETQKLIKKKIIEKDDIFYNKFKDEINDTIDKENYIQCMKKTIKYTMLKIYIPKVLQGDRVEHPAYIKENKLRVDFLFYLTNQIQNPTVQFLECLVDNPNDIFNQAINIENNRRTGNVGLSKFFKIKNTNDNSKRNSINLNIKKKKPINLVKYYLNESDEDPDKLGVDNSKNKKTIMKKNDSDEEKIDTKKYNKLFMDLNRI
jgi:DNA polymerase elongation subunit (family B)